jgi:dTDP-glucose 4,6-dehydratase
MAKLLVTGGYGFIGTHFLIHLLEETDYSIINVDSETYASQKEHIKSFLKNKRQYRRRIKFLKKDIANKKAVEEVFSKHKPQFVVNIAAESHVDNSITGPAPFVTTNITGTFNLLECARKYDVEKFVQVSTDEVYGQLHDIDETHFTEKHNLEPSSVYSASKASADLLVQSYFKTFKLNTCITRCCNNYGPYQHKEKLLPKTILNAVGNLPVPVYGKGTNVREWIHAKDHCSAILTVLQQGKAGETYNVGTSDLSKNIDLVKRVLHTVERSEDLIEHVEDRKGHDFIYAIDSTKIRFELKWEPKITFEQGLRETIEWYKSLITA